MNKGSISELAVAKELSQMGYSVSIPFDDSSRYDLIVDYGDEIERVQVKSGKLDDGRIKFECKSTNYNSNKANVNHYTQDEIDCFMVYCAELDNVYKVDIQDAPNSAMWLRLDCELSKYADEERINWANEYLLQ